jgi:hypothetical protein
MKTILIKKEFKADYITREAGERLRVIIEKSVEDGKPIELDFSDIIVASTSFFDEGIAKLAESGWKRKKLDRLIRFKNLNPRDSKVLERLLEGRGLGK